MTKAQSDGALSSTQPSFSPSATLRIFITVGSTRFDALIASTVLGKSFLQAVSGAIPDGGRLHCIAQYGNSDIPTMLASSSLLEQGDSESSKSSSLGKFNFSLKPSQPSDGVVTPFRSGDTLEATQKSAEGAGQVDLSLFGFASDLRRYIEAADIVISHAGSGTMLEVLRLPPLATGRQRQLIVVPNTSLMDNHQMELAESLASALPQAGQAMKTVQGPFCHVATVENIAERAARVIVDSLAGKAPLKQFPGFDGSSFRHLVDEEMGFL